MVQALAFSFAIVFLFTPPMYIYSIEDPYPAMLPKQDFLQLEKNKFNTSLLEQMVNDLLQQNAEYAPDLIYLVVLYSGEKACKHAFFLFDGYTSLEVNIDEKEKKQIIVQAFTSSVKSYRRVYAITHSKLPEEIKTKLAEKTARAPFPSFESEPLSNVLEELENIFKKSLAIVRSIVYEKS